MVALLRHFLAGSLLLLAVFTPSVDAKAKCTQGGWCIGKKEVPKAGHSYDETFKPIVCEDKCYRFYCLANGGINAGAGCKEDVKKHCPGQADNILNGNYTKDGDLRGDGFVASQCTDDSCQVPNLEFYRGGLTAFTTYPDNQALIAKITVDTCEYNPSPPPPNAAIGYGTPMIFLGSLVAGWILALRLW